MLVLPSLQRDYDAKYGNSLNAKLSKAVYHRGGVPESQGIAFVVFCFFMLGQPSLERYL